MHKLLDETCNQIHKFPDFLQAKIFLQWQLLQCNQVKQNQPRKHPFVIGFVSIATLENVNPLKLWSMWDDHWCCKLLFLWARWTNVCNWCTAPQNQRSPQFTYLANVGSLKPLWHTRSCVSGGYQMKTEHFVLTCILQISWSCILKYFYIFHVRADGIKTGAKHHVLAVRRTW